jgi:hypothetical protein
MTTFKRLALLIVIALVACTGSKDARDDFAAMQARGEHVMGVDQYTSAHVFEDLPDGGRVILDRADAADTAAIAGRAISPSPLRCTRRPCRAQRS